jgi:cytochrome b
MKTFNEALAFALELCALAALAVWGAHAGGATGVKVALAVTAPLLAALVWGMFVAPKASVKLSSASKFAIACLVFAAAAAGLIDAGHAVLGAVLAAAFLANRLILVALGER